MNDRIAELEAARLSCEADEDAALRLQEKLARLRATVAQTRCGSFDLAALGFRFRPGFRVKVKGKVSARVVVRAMGRVQG